MVVSKKDKALILLITSAIILLWFVFSVFFHIFAVTSKSSEIFEPFIVKNQERQWFNLSKNLTKEDLEGRVVLLDFWTYACIECLETIPDMKELQERFGDKLLVVGVHSGRFANEKNSQSIREAIIKYDITYPVIDDSNLKIWSKFQIKAWPTVVLINPRGKVETVFEGSENHEAIFKKVKKLIKKYDFMIDGKPLPVVLEKNRVPHNILNFPTKIEYAKNFSYQDKNSPALIISNSADNNIIISSLNGKILDKIGTKEAGFKDGNLKNASFNYPTGLLYSDNILYVADRGNHTIRKVDFTKGEVTTILGSGIRGGVITKKTNAKEVNLSSPQDLEFFPSKDFIIIANLGTNQLLKYDIKNNSVTPFAGNGKRDMVNGTYPKNSLAQPNGLSAFRNKLYFVDSYSSSLRYVDELGKVETLIGQGLDKFGNKNGKKSEALMQNPLGVYADQNGIYVADSYNHLVRKYDYGSQSISNFSGNGIKANDIGQTTSYNEVSDLVFVENKAYLVDSHNNRIVVKNNGRTSILDIIPALKLPQDGLLEYLPNLEKLPNSTVESDKSINLVVQLKQGWKINEMAPSFFNLVEISGEEATLIASFDWNMVKSGIIKLPKMSHSKQYYLQGTIYYCEDREDALCFIRSYEAKILPSKASEIQEIKITL